MALQWPISSLFPSFPHVLVFYDCMKNCCKLRGLKQHTSVSSQYRRSESSSIAGFCPGSHKAEIKLPARAPAFLETRELIICFQVQAGYWPVSLSCGQRVRDLFLRWLAARGHSQVLDATHRPCPMPPPSSSQ